MKTNNFTEHPFTVIWNMGKRAMALATVFDQKSTEERVRS